jgi:hypothetical protein
MMEVSVIEAIPTELRVTLGKCREVSQPAS